MKTRILLLLFIFTISFFSGCLKRGPEDPGISFLTRRERLTGKWKLVKYEYTYDQGSYQGHGGYIRSYSFDGTAMSETFSGEACCKPFGNPYYDTTYTNVYSFSMNLTIEKKGSYSKEMNDAGSISSISDQWNWETSEPNKTKINFNSWDKFDINRLSNKEMILSKDYKISLLSNLS